MATMNISLPDQMKEWVEAQVATGRYANVSDYMRDILRRDQERAEALAELRAEIQKGIDSGPPVPFDFDQFRAEMMDKHGHAQAG